MAYIGNQIYQSAFVTDTFSGNGSTTAFTMSVAPAGTTNVLVAISGVLQDPSTYGVVGTTITFSSAPPTGTGNISCRYLGIPVTGVTTTAYRTVTEFTATANQKTFTPPSYTVGFINVYRNGVLLGSADYVATNGTTVVLTTGATSGDLVTVESFLVSSVLNAIPNTAGAINVGGTLISGTLPVVNGGTGVTTSTGTSSVVRATSPTLTTPIVSTTMGVGGATPSASGSGITFPATQSASANANTLDDYEEGDFIPGWNGGTLTVTSCKYVKIGKFVNVSYDISFGSSSSSAASAVDLPFSSDSITFQTGSFNYSTLGTSFITINIDTGASSTRAVSFRTALNGGSYTCSAMATNRCIFTLTYIAGA